MIPIQSAWEYLNARITREAYRSMAVKSDNDIREYKELCKRIDAYQLNPAKPNIIEHNKGNI